MLILTRKLGESITIGDDIKIQVLEIKGKQVRLGIQAPKNYAIHREEIYQRIQEENKLAAQQSPLSLKNISDILRKKKMSFRNSMGKIPIPPKTGINIQPETEHEV